MASAPHCWVCTFVKHDGDRLLCLKHRVVLPKLDNPYIICHDFKDVSLPEPEHLHWWIKTYLPLEGVLYQHFEGYEPPKVVAPFKGLEQI